MTIKKETKERGNYMDSKKDKQKYIRDVKGLANNLAAKAFNTKNGKKILNQCLDIAELLLDKNKKYDNSAFESINIFSSQNAIDKVRGRIDSKIKRIQKSNPSDQEDSITDLIGYLIILKILREK